MPCHPAPRVSSTWIRRSTPARLRQGDACAHPLTTTATGSASEAGATAANSSPSLAGPTRSTTTSAFSRRDSTRRVASSSPTGHSSFTSTTARSTTARCCSTASSAARGFMNEIIWAYDYGGRSKSRWPAKHDTIFWYAIDPHHYVFDYDEMDRIPYMAPRLVTPGEGGARQDAHRRLVAHDREPDRQGEDRLPHAEAARHPASASSGSTQTPAIWCSTSSPAAARPAKQPRDSGETTSWSTAMPMRWRS